MLPFCYLFLGSELFKLSEYINYISLFTDVEWAPFLKSFVVVVVLLQGKS